MRLNPRWRPPRPRTPCLARDPGWSPSWALPGAGAGLGCQLAFFLCDLEVDPRQDGLVGTPISRAIAEDGVCSPPAAEHMMPNNMMALPAIGLYEDVSQLGTNHEDQTLVEVLINF